MTFHRLQVFSTLAAIAGLVTSCSSSPNSGSKATPGSGSGSSASSASGSSAGSAANSGTSVPPGPGTMACNLDTTAVAGAIYAMDPTLGIQNGPYPGDNVCIAAPDPALGMAFHYGPANYDDPAAVTPFVLKPGEEITDCVTFTTPNTSTIYFHEYHARMRPQSHHMLLFLGASPQGGSTSNLPHMCNQGATQRNLFGAQTQTLDLSSLAQGAPEADGLASQIAPTQLVEMQAHFVNARSTPILREVWANIVYVDKSQVKELADPLFFISGYTMNIPMGQSQVITGSAVVPTNAASDFRLVMATPHYHAHTKRFTAYVTVGGQKSLLFEEFGQSTFQQPYTEISPEPQFWYYTSTQTNPTPDPNTQTAGAYTGPLYLKPGDQIDWECEIVNNDVSPNATNPLYNSSNNGRGATGITFANAVYSGEMCNVFGMYAPSLNPDTGCSWKGGQVTLISSANSCP